jgi:two-component system osmolarity sensor histidine kinase EnvZ
MASNMAGEVVFFIGQLEQSTPGRQRAIADDFGNATGINVYFDKRSAFKANRTTSEFADFQQLLRNKLKHPITVRKIHGTDIEICVQMETESVRMEMTAKRLESRTTTIFIMWMVAATFIFLMIAVLFLRNQIRPITRLAAAAESFGRGVDMPDFRPHGANEVRRAARAFVVMRERIKRQMRTRTEMLAGISHDLRTPLTRIKLQLAMLSDQEAVKELGDDVQQMEHMIQEYLDFARGEGREEALRVDLSDLLEEVVADYQRSGAAVTFVSSPDLQTDIRVSAFRRVLHNLIDNALRYGKKCEVKVKLMQSVNSGYAEITIDDDGPGIAPAQREEVFKPFTRLDPSRNVNTGGVGLGLTIARDVVLAHGGSISLDASSLGGLRVAIKLPL